MSLTSIRNRTNKLSKVVMWIAAFAMVASAFAGLGSYLTNAPSAADQPNPKTDVIVTVNGSPITRGMVEREMSQFGNTSPEEAGMMHYFALDQLIHSTLIPQIAAAKHITASSAAIAKIRNEALTQLRTELGLSKTASEGEIDSALQQNAHTSLADVVKDDDLKKQALAEAYEASLKQQSVPTPDDIAKYYGKWHTEHILISNKSMPDAQALDRANKIIAQLNASKGANFEDLVKQYSDDPGTKNKGGDDGWIDKDKEYVPEFKDAAFAMQKGQWSRTPVVSPSFGYFIIKVVDFNPNLPKDQATKDKDIATITSQKSDKIAQDDLNTAKATMKLAFKDLQYEADYQANASQFAGMSGGVAPTPSDPKALLALYDKALTQTKDPTAIAQIQCARATLFSQAKDTTKELAAYEAAKSAEGSVPDPKILKDLADLYKTANNPAAAIANYQLASKYDYDSLPNHQDYKKAFTDLKRTDLAAAEDVWIANYNKTHPPTPSPSAGGPGGNTISIGGNGPQTVTIPAKQ